MEKILRGCPCVGKKEDPEVRVLDYSHCSLEHVPSEVFNVERTLEELSLDANQIRDLPRELFYCHSLRKLSVCDNELTQIPPAIASLLHLEELDISKNGIVSLPDNIKGCKYLRYIEASVNPLGRLPEGFTQLLNITELYMNDTFLDYLPGSFGRLTKLRILEVRENHLKTLPKSISRLTNLERLDIGNNEFTELPDVIGCLTALFELWCDFNQITHIPACIGQLTQLMYLDASRNRIEWIAEEIGQCNSLADLHLSTNLLQQLPENIGQLNSLTTLKVDDNKLTSIPFGIGGLTSMSELNISANDLEELPPSIGFLRHLRTLYADENFLYAIPSELGSCNGLTVLSFRSNNLEYIPDEIGRIPRLRVLNLSDNRISCLPYSLTRLKELQALWLSENQTKPLVRLQPDIDTETGQRMLTCYLLPQQPTEDKDDIYSDGNSFHPSMWEEERAQRQRIHFDFENIEDEEGRLERTPTPYPKEMKNRSQHMKNLLLKELKVAGGDARRDKVPQSTARPEQQPLKPITASSLPLPPIPTSSDTDRLQAAGATNAASDTYMGEAKIGKPVSPIVQERHVLYLADKEKMARDKKKMSHRSGGEDETSRYTSSATQRPGHIVAESQPELNSTKPSLQQVMRPGKAGDMNDGSYHQPNARRRASDQHSRGQSYDHQAGDIRQAPPHRSLHSNSLRVRNQRGVHYEVNNNGVTYNDFLTGLSVSTHSLGQQSLTSESKPSHYTHPDRQYRPSQGGRRHRRGHGYESDGYMSDVSHRQRGRHSHQPRYAASEIGYSSDMDRSQRRRKSGSGYASDTNMYMGRRAQTRYRPIASNAIDNAMLDNFRVPHQQPSALEPPLGSYSNVPFSKRSSLRNDEMYESYQNASPIKPYPVMTKPPKYPSRASSTAGSVSRLDQPQQNNGILQLQAPPGVQREGSRSASHQELANEEVRQDPSANRINGIQASPNQNAGESPDDEDWKNKLYEASVKLQQTPSNNRSNPSTPIVSRSRSDVSDKGYTPPSIFTPPPAYRPTPPYTPQRPETVHQNINQTSETPHQQQQQNQSTLSGHNRTLDGNGNTLTPVHSRYSKNNTPAKQTSAIHSYTTPSSRTHEPIQALNNENLDMNKNNSFRESGDPVASPVQVSLMATSPRKFKDSPQPYALSNGQKNSPIRGRMYERMNQTGSLPGHGTPAKQDRSYTSYNVGATLQQTPQMNRTHPTINNSYPTSQYENDVAMYKQSDPLSQVSSSADSGYAPNMTFDKTHPGDPAHKLIADGFSPADVRTPYRSSPARDSALGSDTRDSTPGSNTMSPSNSINNHQGDVNHQMALTVQVEEESGYNDYPSPHNKEEVIEVTIYKNPGLGFSIAGGVGSQGNPFRKMDDGIFVTKVQDNGPAASELLPGDKILEVSGTSFVGVDHADAVNMLRMSQPVVTLLVERFS